MFLTSPYLAKPGTRLRLEVSDGNEIYSVETIVARIKKTPAELRRALGAGMGVRFMNAMELMGEMLPGVDLTSREEVGQAPGGAYRVRFRDAALFLKTYTQDIMRGGLFVSTDRIAPTEQTVQIELIIPGAEDHPVRFAAKVVHRVEPRLPREGAAELVGGIGVALVDHNAVTELLRPHAERLSKTKE